MEQSHVSGASQHEDGKSNQVQAGLGFGQALVISFQPRIDDHPGIFYLAARQEHEVALRLRQLSPLWGDPVRARRLDRTLASVILLHIGELHALAGGVLHDLDQLGGSTTIVPDSSAHASREHVAARVDSQAQRGAAAALERVLARALAALGWMRLVGNAHA